MGMNVNTVCSPFFGVVILTTMLCLRPDLLLCIGLTFNNYRCASIMANHWLYICKQSNTLWYTVNANNSSLLVRKQHLREYSQLRREYSRRV